MACRIGAAFFGESMFSRAADASKVALVHLVARLNAGGFRLLDAQFINPHLARLGRNSAQPKAEYHELLEPALAADADYFKFTQDGDPDVVLAYAHGEIAGLVVRRIFFAVRHWVRHQALLR